jgi:hypothetical protein
MDDYDLLWSTGSKLVSFLLSKPVPNCIWGTEQEPKLAMLELLTPLTLVMEEIGRPSTCSTIEKNMKAHPASDLIGIKPTSWTD